MKYSKTQITYHWLTVALLVIMALSGFAYSYDWIGNGIIRLHQVAGQLLILVLCARLASRLFGHRPVDDIARAFWERQAARVVHASLYVCLIAYVVTGYVAASGLRDPLLIAPLNQALARSDGGELFLEAHFALKWVLLVLVSVHIAATLKHRFWDKDDTFSQMTFTSKKG